MKIELFTRNIPAAIIPPINCMRIYSKAFFNSIPFAINIPSVTAGLKCPPLSIEIPSINKIENQILPNLTQTCDKNHYSKSK